MTPKTTTPVTSSKAIGSIITWQSPSVVAYSLLKLAIVKAGLDEKLARELHDYSKLARTARGLAKERGATKRIARPIEGKRARQLSAESTLDDGLRYKREAVLAIDETGFHCDAPALEAAARAEFDAVGDRRTAQDITRLVKRIVEAAGSDLMPLREQGGVYFVPSGHKVIDQLRVLLSEVGGSLRTFSCKMGDGSDESIAVVVSEYLMSEIADLRDSVAKLDDDARADVKARRMERLGELRTKMAAYATLLAASASSVEKALSDADKEIVQKLSAA